MFNFRELLTGDDLLININSVLPLRRQSKLQWPLSTMKNAKGHVHFYKLSQSNNYLLAKSVPHGACTEKTGSILLVTNS